MSDAGREPSETALPRCPECGAEVRCGARLGETRCWCFDRPPVAPDPALPADACLCPRCLETRGGGEPAGGRVPPAEGTSSHRG